MSLGQPFQIGRGTTLRGCLCPPNGGVPGTGDDNSTIALSNLLTVEVDGAVAAGATAITLLAGSGFPAGSPIVLAGQWLGFRNASGATVPVQLTTNVDPTLAEDVSLVVAPVSQAIEDGATAEYPPIVGLRTSFNLNRQGARTTSFVFERDGHETGRNATISSGFTMSGNFAPLDAGYLTMLYSWQKGLPVFLQAEYPQPDSLATRGNVVQGAGSITSIPVTTPSNEIITSDIEGAFDELPTEYPVLY